MKRILVIAAHPDDEVLGCGGAIARLTSEGGTVSILILANGLTSRVDFDANQKDQLLKTHHDRAIRAGKLLGASEVNLAGFPDQLMDTVPLLDITHAIEKEIQRQNKKLETLSKEKKALDGRISSPKFLESAPEDVIILTKERISEIEQQSLSIQELLKSLSQ